MTVHKFFLQTGGGIEEKQFSAPPGCPVDILHPSVDLVPLGPREAAGALNGRGWDYRARTLFVVNDHQRPTPTASLLSFLNPPLANWPEAYFVVATGSHRAPREDEREAIFGKDLYSRIRDRVIIHDAKAGGHIGVGETDRGFPVSVNAALFDCRVLVTIGSVEPHYFAGYTGGRKSIVPGLASFETIRLNHSLVLDHLSRVLRLEDNPIHVDLEEGTELVLQAARQKGLREVVSVNAVSLGEKIFMIDRGDVSGSVERCRGLADRLFVRDIERLYPMVIAVAGYPMNRDLYQAMKAFEHGRMALAQGGVLILVASCDKGLGPEHFISLASAAADGAKFRESMSRNFELGSQKFANVVAHREGGSHFFLNTGADLPGLEGQGIRIFASLDEAVTRAAGTAAGFEESPAILVIEEATNLVPRLPPRRTIF